MVISVKIYGNSQKNLWLTPQKSKIEIDNKYINNNR